MHLAPLIILQKRLIRLISNADFLAHTEPLFKKIMSSNLEICISMYWRNTRISKRQ